MAKTKIDTPHRTLKSNMGAVERHAIIGKVPKRGVKPSVSVAEKAKIAFLLRMGMITEADIK